MKEATGTARITFTMGRNSQSAQERAGGNDGQQGARRRRPQGEAAEDAAQAHRRCPPEGGPGGQGGQPPHTSRGEGRSRAPCPGVYTVSTQMAASCQAPSQKARGTTTRSIFVWFDYGI